MAMGRMGEDFFSLLGLATVLPSKRIFVEEYCIPVFTGISGFVKFAVFAVVLVPVVVVIAVSMTKKREKKNNSSSLSNKV